jgi:WhiB family redox-sensing transcriptional regulator
VNAERLAERAYARIHDAGWMREAACRGMDTNLFFPITGQHAVEAKTVCARCPVAEACRDYALKSGEKWGVWGGMTEKDRKTVRRARKVA